jgi:1-aminocyclopropane-1-carboxylate deaminase
VELPSFRDVQIDLSPWDLPHTPFFLRLFDASVPEISGNKAFKLRPYLENCREGETVLSWGGAYSNHLLALSAAAKQNRLNSIGIIRGDEEGLDNAWLRAMRQNGMRLHFVTRSEYQHRNDDNYCREMAQKFGAGCIVPEGGKGMQGIRGAAEMVQETELYAAIALPGGTGTTAAGIAQKLKNTGIKIVCLHSFKEAAVLWNELQVSCGIQQQQLPNLNIIDTLNLGRFGKEPPEAAKFRSDFYRHTSIMLDTVYGSKAMLGLIRLLQNGALPSRDLLLYIHTGGLGPH